MRAKAVFTSLLLVLLFARAAPSQQPAALPPPSGTPGVGSVVVQVCVDTKGYLTEEPTVVASSGQNQLDEGAIKLAKSGSGKYIPPTKDGKAVPGCIKFRVKFDLKDSPPPSS
jgi:TonB family protein